MRTIALIAVLGLCLTSCGLVSRVVAGLTDTSRICVAGVSYLQFTSGASVEYTPDGKIKTCK